MTTDRTRAIVEAAERLAKGLDLSVTPSGGIYRTGNARECECDHEDDLDALLIPLGRALALPEAPPVPESKLRALEAAARLYAQRAEKCRQRGEKDGPWCDEIVDALEALESTPAPQWQSEPPAEIGAYWVRRSTAPKRTEIAHRVIGSVWIASMWENKFLDAAELAAQGIEFWPERIVSPLEHP